MMRAGYISWLLSASTLVLVFIYVKKPIFLDLRVAKEESKGLSNAEGALDLLRESISNYSFDCLEHRDDILNFCENMANFTDIRINCQSHKREFAPALDVDVIPHESCVTLWFAGFRDDINAHCDAKGNGYRIDYGRALMSYRKHAMGVLQPVLMLGQDGLNSAERNKSAVFAKWTEERGAIVLFIDELSFQNYTRQWCCPNSPNRDGFNGPFLRLDIPKFVADHKLFDLQGVCPGTVLYTDADIIFMNNITHKDVAGLKTFLKNGAILLYGREYDKLHKRATNTGVMLMDVVAFGDEWARIVKWAAHKDNFVAYDQGLLNDYFSQSSETEKKRAMLPIHWNWKPYWRLEPSLWSDIKILHFHGPKFGRGLEHIAYCNYHLQDFSIPPYKPRICCDGGKTAYRALQLDREFRPSTTEIC